MTNVLIVENGFDFDLTSALYSSVKNAKTVLIFARVPNDSPTV